MKKWAITGLLCILVGWAVLDMFRDDAVKIEQKIDAEGVGLDVGNYAPDFKLLNLEGEEVSLADYLGKKVIINFWATWCPPCRAEMPHMQKFYEDYQQDGIEILAINLTRSERDQRQIEKFLEDYGITFPILLDEDDYVNKLYQAYSIPTTYLINSDGTVHLKMVGPMSYDWMVRQIGEMY